MEWKCPDCGSQNSEDDCQCKACGFRKKKPLSMKFTNDRSIQINIPTAIGHNTWACYHDDSEYLDTKQFCLDNSGGKWTIAPEPETTNETMLNNEVITKETDLQNGDVIGVGREGKIVHLVTVSL